MLRVLMGQLPARPTAAVEGADMADALWNLVERCRSAAEIRPSIDEVIMTLKTLCY